MLKVHFLNVGHGDCAIIEHPSGRITMIDINNASTVDTTTLEEIESYYRPPLLTLGELLQPQVRVTPLLCQIPPYSRPSSSLLELPGFYTARSRSLPAGYDVALENPLAFLKSMYPNRAIFRYIQSHPDLDHMRGLAALLGSGIEIVNFWDTDHDKIPEFQSDNDRVDWGAYQRVRNGEAGVRVLRLFRGEKGSFWNQGGTPTDFGDGIEVLSPTPELVKAARADGNTNNLSYVLKIAYAGINIILGADAEENAWASMVRHYGAALKCHVLKASHHGRDSGYHQETVKLMNPEYTVVSVGKKPETDASNKYRRYTRNEQVWSTRWKGTITLTVNDHGRGEIESAYRAEAYAAP